MAGWRPAPPPGPPLPAGTVAFGMRDGTEIPLPAVAGRGLGLTGPGAPDAARALLIGLLAAASPGRGRPGAQVVIPVADIGQLIGDHQEAQIPGVVPGLPDGLIIAPGLAGALDHIETEITHRLRLLGAGGDGDLSAPEPPGTTGEAALPPLALIATVDQASARRVQAVLEAGTGAGVVGVVLGDWAAGIACRISADGTVLAATDAGLAGAEAFHLPAPDAATMLGLLRGAQGHVTADTPGTPDTGSGQEPGAVARPAEPPRDHTDDAPGGDHASPHAARQRPAAQPPPGQDRAASPKPKPKAAPPAGGPLAAPGDVEPQTRRSSVSALSTGIEATVTQPVHIAVLGPLQVTALGREIRGGLRKARELLAYLALHPDGVTGEAISEALWPESGPRYATAQRNLALRKAREMLRTATGLSQPMFITLASERYRLDPALIHIDLWRFEAALDQARTTDDESTQLAVLQQAAALYHGPLVDGAAYDWAERYAEPLRRRVLDALARIAEILQDRDPGEALTTLETALAHDPYNEAVYQKIMGIQARLGRLDAARRTLSLLETRLTELGVTPGAQTRQAAAALLGPPGPPPARPQPPGRSPAP
jgi:DNA-binding SARP family transcriptional activator